MIQLSPPLIWIAISRKAVLQALNERDKERQAVQVRPETICQSTENAGVIILNVSLSGSVLPRRFRRR